MKRKYTPGLKEVRKLVSDIGELKIQDIQKDEKLWYILSALRGPDEGDADVKYASTARLRAVVVPNLARANGATISDKPLALLNYSEKLGDHFIAHFNRACGAIALLYPPKVKK